MNFRLIAFEEHGDERGTLVALEADHNCPFDVKRVYYIYGTKAGVRRGYHAHRALKQLAVVVRGSCKFLLDDGAEVNLVTLDQPDRGLYIEGLVWREMYDFSDDCVLMVLADQHYDERDYIRDYEKFKQAVMENGKS
jgi:dTDP-4-dehydrorhamnose 3,5-epimerase-like enzyme